MKSDPNNIRIALPVAGAVYMAMTWAAAIATPGTNNLFEIWTWNHPGLGVFVACMYLAYCGSANAFVQEAALSESMRVTPEERDIIEAWRKTGRL